MDQHAEAVAVSREDAQEAREAADAAQIASMKAELAQTRDLPAVALWGPDYRQTVEGYARDFRISNDRASDIIQDQLKWWSCDFADVDP